MNQMKMRTRSEHASPEGVSWAIVGKLTSAMLLGLLVAGVSHGPAFAESLSPEVVPTGVGPTGYAVTFRYKNPDASRVQIKGEWYFARPGELPQRAATPDNPLIESQGILPEDWQVGDIPLAHPNSTGPNWPVFQMTKDENGVWSYTTPLPSGTFTYSFFVDCATDDQSGCQAIGDPSNPAWGDPEMGALVPNSQVYVPSDPNFNTVDYSWQAPAMQRGKLVRVSYDSPDHVEPENTNNLVIYTPPRYDANREEPYPTLYISHGGGENEMGWNSQGVLQNIMDNMINTGQAEPMIIVMPNGSGYPQSDFNEAYDQDMITRVIPLIESQYNVSKSADDRAFSGLSMGGLLTNSFIIKHPQVFKYYGMMSAGLPPAFSELTPEQATALDGKVIAVLSGWQDTIHAAGFRDFHRGPAREVKTFLDAGVPVIADFIDGGHEWYVWRILLKDFVSRIAFKPLPYATWQ